jgi:hypothetical protein
MDCALQLIPQASESVLDLCLHHDNNNADDDGVTRLSSVDKRQDISHRSHHQLLLLLDSGVNVEDVLCGICSGKDQQANELRASCFLHVARLLNRSSRISLGSETGFQLYLLLRAQIPPFLGLRTGYLQGTPIHQHT